jgi:hypothetical protein
MHRRPTTYRGAIRRAMNVSTLEGLLAEWVSSCAGGGALMAWALHLGAPVGLVVLLAALPALAQGLQLPAARFTARLGARRAALVFVLAARQPYAVLAALPWLPVPPAARPPILAAIAILATGLGAASQQAWLTWTMALFRGPIRGRMLMRRAGRMAVAGQIGALAVGALLDRSGGAGRTALLSVLASVAWVAGLASAAVLARQHAPRAARRRRRLSSVGPALAHRPVRRGLGWVVAWNAAVGSTASAGATFMVQQLGLGFVPLAAHGLAGAACGSAAAPLWGRLLDRAGAARVLVTSALGAALLPFLWLAVSRRALWPIAVDGVLGGLLLGSHGVAAASLARRLAPRGRAPEVVATYTGAAGLAFAGASLAGGFVAARLPLAVAVGGMAIAAKKAVFLAGGAARVGAAALSGRVLRAEREARAGDGRPAKRGEGRGPAS